MTGRSDINASTLDLQPGEYVFGVTDPGLEDNEAVLVSGGYRVMIPDAPPNSFVYARVESTDHKKFGANTATATPVNTTSATAAAERTRTGLRYQTQDGRWLPANRGPIEHDLIEKIVTTARQGESRNAILPGYDPRTAVAVAVELVLNTDIGSKIGLYSPGTRTHWGTKKEIRGEYERYGLSPEVGDTDDATRLTTICPHTSISNGRLKDSSSESQLVITKDADELVDGPKLDYLVVNHLSRSTPDHRSTLQGLRDRREDTPVITLWSAFTKQESESLPRYGPPFDFDTPPLIPDATLAEADIDLHETGRDRESYSPGSDTETLPSPPTTADFDRLTTEHTVTFKRLSDPSLTDLLEDAFSEWQNLKDAGSGRGANLVFNALMFFHRLPLPREYYDDVVQQRSYDGEIFLPKIGDDHLEELEDYSTDSEYSLLHARKTLEGVQHELQANNPMFEQLLSVTKRARDEGRRIAILVASKTTSELLEEALCTELGTDDIGSQVDVVTLDSARDMRPVEQLFVCGPQRPNYCSFYIHPRTDITTVLTYTDWGERMIARQIRDYAEDLDSLLPGGIDVSLPDATETPDTDDSVQTGGNSEDNPTGPSGDPSALNEIPDHLTEQDVQRLRDIAELQPTKNGELCDRWGYDSGSEVYQYLSTNLGSHYTRDEDSKIVLSSQGESLLQDLDQPTP